MHDIVESTKVDCALRAQTGSTAYNGEYFKMTEYAKALFVVHATGVLTGTDMVLKVYEAINAAGGGTPQQLGADVTMTQGILLVMCAAQAQGTTSVNDTVIIQPYTFSGQGGLTAGTALTFTAKAVESLANRQFYQAGTADEEATSLAACINDATYGVPGVLATASTDTVTLTMDEPGDGAFTITESAAAKIVVTDLIQQMHFEVAVQDMDRADDFTHVQARLSGVASGDTVWATIIRAVAGYQPVGQVSAAYDDAS